MTVQVYKKAESLEEKRATSLIHGVECIYKNITINELSYHLERGYYKTPGEWDEPEKAEDEPESEAALNPIRVAAKEAGIEGYKTKRITTLTGELDAIQNTGD